MLLLSGCGPTVGDPVGEVSSTIATVVVVRFTTPFESEAWVEYGEDDGFGWRTPTTTGTEHVHPLVGLPSGSTYRWRVVVDGEALETQETDNDLLPADFPELTVTEDAATWDGWLVTTLVGLWQGPVIFDNRGRVVWYYDDTRGDTTVIRALPLADGRGIAYNIVATTEVVNGEIVEVDWGGEPIDSTGVPGNSHDFVELPDGRFAALQIEKETLDGELVIGDRITVYDDDGYEVLWNSFDWLDPYSTGLDRIENSWTHANSLHYYPDEEVFRVGLRNLETIGTIDAATGEPLDWFGGEVNEGWTFEDDERTFSYQHNFDWLGDRVLIFDNGEDYLDDTRVVEYALDSETKTASKLWSYHYEPSRWIYALGDVKLLEDESRLVSWSVAGRLEQVVDQDPVWRIEASVGTGFGYLFPQDSLWD